MKTKLLLLCSGLFVAACSTPSFDEGKPVAELSNILMEDSTARVKNLERPFIVDSGHMKVVGHHFKVKDEPVLPPVFERHFAWSWQVPTDYREIATKIGQDTNVQIRFTSDAMAHITLLAPENSGGKQSPIGAQRNTNNQGPDNRIARRMGDGAPSESPSSTQSISGSHNTTNTKFNSLPMSFETAGTLIDALDVFSNALSLHWKYEEDKVVIFKQETITYELDTLPGSMRTSGSVATSVASSGSANTSSSFKTESSLNNPEIWDVLTQSVESVISPGGKYVASPQTGTLKVTDDPEVQRKVAEIVAQFNEDLALTIMYKVDIVEVLNENSDEFTFSLADLIYNNPGRNAFNVTSGLAPLDSAGTLIAGTVLKPASRFAGTKTILGALSKKVNIVSHKVLYGQSTNGITVPIQDVRETTYLAERSQTTNGDNVEVSLTPGVATEGVSVFLTGMRGSDGGLLLQADLYMATIESLTAQGTETEFIQGPTLQKKSTTARSTVSAGDIMIASLQETTVSNNARSGVGHYNNLLTGGSRMNAAGRRFVLVMVTPYFKAAS